MILPVFTLPIFLLPQGHTRLRVFEPRYLKLVRIAAQKHGFVIYHGKQEFDVIGSHVQIVNFEQGDDGVLIIDVYCKALVNLSKFKVDEDNLTFANVYGLSHWDNKVHSASEPDVTSDDKTDQLSAALRDVFEDNITLKEIYNSDFKDDPIWVVARWVEILPVKFADKRAFLTTDSFNKAKDFVHSIVFEQCL